MLENIFLQKLSCRTKHDQPLISVQNSLLRPETKLALSKNDHAIRVLAEVSNNFWAVVVTQKIQDQHGKNTEKEQQDPMAFSAEGSQGHS